MNGIALFLSFFFIILFYFLIEVSSQELPWIVYVSVYIPMCVDVFVYLEERKGLHIMLVSV